MASCMTCKHGDIALDDAPCKDCVESGRGHSYNWEPEETPLVALGPDSCPILPPDNPDAVQLNLKVLEALVEGGVARTMDLVYIADVPESVAVLVGDVRVALQRMKDILHDMNPETKPDVASEYLGLRTGVDIRKGRE